MKKIIMVLMVLFAVNLAGKTVFAAEGTAKAAVAPKAEKKAAKPKIKKAAKVIYTCPMCHVDADKPGKCPECGMDMVKKMTLQPGKAHGKKKMEAAKGFTCPMCHVDAEKPGKCPMCGMDMVQKTGDMKKASGDGEKM